MTEVALALSFMLLLVLLPSASMRYRAVFCIYLFVFIPLYLLICREFYVHSVEATEISHRMTLIKEFAWLYVIGSFLLGRYLRRETISFPRGLATPILVFCAYLLLQVVRGAQAVGMHGELVLIRENLLYIPAAFVALYLVQDVDDVARLAKAYCYCMLAASLYGLVQIVAEVQGLDLLRPESQNPQFLYSSFFLNSNTMAWFASTVLALVLPQHWSFQKNEWLYHVAVSLSVFWMIAGQSLIAIIALIVICATNMRTTREPLKLAGSLLSCCVFSVGVLTFVRPEMLMSHPFLGALLEQTTMLHPSFGHGVGMFGAYDIRSLFLEQPQALVGTNNVYFSLALTGGILGLILFGWLMLKLLTAISALTTRSQSDFMRHAAFGLQTALVVNVLYLVPANSLQNFPENLHFWFLMGCSAALINVQAAALVAQQSMSSCSRDFRFRHGYDAGWRGVWVHTLPS